MNYSKLITLSVIILFLAAACFPGSLRGTTGVGIILGEPTGLSLKFDSFPLINNACMGIAWSFSGYLHLHCDYWFMNPSLQTSGNQFNWYLGLGVKFLFYSSGGNNRNNTTGLGMGARVPVGLQYYLEKEWELFAELVPGIRFFPATDFDLDIGIGIRYHFGEKAGKSTRNRGTRRKRSRLEIKKAQLKLMDNGLELYRKKHYKGARNEWQKCNALDPGTKTAESARQYIIKVNNLLKSIGEK